MKKNSTSTSRIGPKSSALLLPTLHTDVLIEIVNHVPEDHAARFLLVGSRVLYNQAILKTLKRITLRHSKSIDGFLSVLASPLSHGRSRYHAVRAIQFGYLKSLQSLTKDRLVEAISQLEHLRELSIPFAEELLRDLPALPSALSNLLFIQSVSATHVGARFCRMLKKMKSRLVSISMNFFLHFDVDDYNTMYDYLAPNRYAAHHPVTFLSHMSGSLEELRIIHCHTQLYERNLDDALLTFTHVYPKMRILDIRERARTTLRYFPRVFPYVRAFPNLAEIHITSELEIDTDESSRHQRQANSIRTLNEADLLHSGRFWERLNRFVGPLSHLYMLGPIGSIAQIHLTSWIKAQTDLRMLATCVDSVRPTHLKLKGYSCLFAHTEDASGTPGSLADILRRPGAEGIQSLVADITLSHYWVDNRDPRDIDIAHQLDTLAVALKSLPLSRLRLRIKVRHVNRPRDPSPSVSFSPSPPPLPTPCIAETSAARIDVPAFLHALCAAIPTLTDAYVTLNRQSAAELRARDREYNVASDDTGDRAEECLHWARVPAAREAEPEGAQSLEEDREMFELD